MLDPIPSEQELVPAIIDALHSVPNVRAELLALEKFAANGYPLDAEIAVYVQEKRFVLRVETRRELYPRDAREVLWRMGPANRGPEDPPTINFIAANSISPGAKEFLRTQHVGYYDRGGSLFIPAPGAYIYIDKSPAKSMVKAIRSLFSGSRAQVIHALLLHPREWLTGKDLAEEAQVSTATVSQVNAELERMELLKPNPQGAHKGRQVREPGALLDQWAQHLGTLKLPAFRRYFLPALRGDQAILEAVANAFALHNVQYALSFEAAAQAYAPFLSSISQLKCRSLPGPPLEDALAVLNARAVEEGANLFILDTRSAGELLFREQHGNAWLASPIQVYLDLLRSEGRAKEQAQHLRQERIGF